MDYRFYAKVGNKYLKNKKLVSKGRDEFDVNQGSFAKYISKYEDVALNILNGKDVTFSEAGA